MTLYIKEVTGSTLVGKIGNDLPFMSGNCFSVEASDGKEYKIVNFNLENYEGVIDRGVESVKIKIISDHHAIIHDERIPHNWYDKRWCAICCPNDLLPITQQLELERDEMSGVRTVYEGGLVRTDHSKRVIFKD